MLFSLLLLTFLLFTVYLYMLLSMDMQAQAQRTPLFSDIGTPAVHITETHRILRYDTFCHANSTFLWLQVDGLFSTGTNFAAYTIGDNCYHTKQKPPWDKHALVTPKHALAIH